jgi:hypothetical protein
MRLSTVPQRRLRLAPSNRATAAVAVPRAEPRAAPVRKRDWEWGGVFSATRSTVTLTHTLFSNTLSNHNQSTGTAEFDGGVGVAAFRPPAPAARSKPALGRPGVAAFDKGTGKAAFSAR